MHPEGVISLMMCASPTDGIKEMDSSRRGHVCYSTSDKFDPRFPYCVITIVIRVLLLSCSFLSSHSFVDNYIGSKKQKFLRKKPKKI